MPLCNNATKQKHELVEGDRKVTIALGLTWGQRDIRDEWKGDYAFCSFQCLAEWATSRGVEHDQHVLVDGEPPEDDQPA